MNCDEVVTILPFKENFGCPKVILSFQKNQSVIKGLLRVTFIFSIFSNLFAFKLKKTIVGQGCLCLYIFFKVVK
jgi:hypothetical protein